MLSFLDGSTGCHELVQSIHLVNLLLKPCLVGTDHRVMFVILSLKFSPPPLSPIEAVVVGGLVVRVGHRWVLPLLVCFPGKDVFFSLQVQSLDVLHEKVNVWKVLVSRVPWYRVRPAGAARDDLLVNVDEPVPLILP